MSAIPSHWALRSLSSLVTEVKGSLLLEAGKPYELWSVPSFADGAPQMVDGAAVGSAKRPVRPNDVLLCKINPRINRVWEVGPARGPAQVASLEWITLRAKDKSIDPGFLRHYLSSPGFRTWITSEVSGVTGSHTRARPQRVLQLLVPVPPPREQRRIVDILEDHLSRLDAAVHGMRTASARLAALWNAALQRSIVGPLHRLGDLADDASYGTSVKCAVNGLGVPVARIPNIVDGAIDMTDCKRALDAQTDLSHLLLRRDDFLIVRTNGSRELIGRSAVVQADLHVAFASYLIRYRLKSAKVLPVWLQLAFESPGIREVLEKLAASSAGQYNLGLAKLDALQVPCPELSVQRETLSRLHELREGRRLLQVAMEQQSRRSDSLRKALLTAAFSGKLTGRRADKEVIAEMAQ